MQYFMSYLSGVRCVKSVSHTVQYFMSYLASVWAPEGLYHTVLYAMFVDCLSKYSPNIAVCLVVCATCVTARSKVTCVTDRDQKSNCNLTVSDTLSAPRRRNTLISSAAKFVCFLLCKVDVIWSFKWQTYVYLWKQEISQPTQFLEQMVGQCWPIVYDAGPALDQHWLKVSYLLGSPLTNWTSFSVTLYWLETIYRYIRSLAAERLNNRT